MIQCLSGLESAYYYMETRNNYINTRNYYMKNCKGGKVVI